MPAHKLFEYSQIDENVFIGTNACCQMHYDKMLLAHGITCDISLEGERIDQPYGAELFLWLPTPDHTVPERRKLEIGLESLDAMLRRGCKVFLHCKNGHGRAPTFYAAYLIRFRGRSLEQAVRSIKTQRPRMHLEPVQREFLQSFV